MTGPVSIKELLVTAFNPESDIPEPQQLKAEISALLATINERDPQTVVEVGTASGGTFYLLCNGINGIEQVVSVDLPGVAASKEQLRALSQGVNVHAIRGDSQRVDTKRTLECELDGAPVDVLVIDADHSYEGVRRDYELYAPLVASDGLIALHDIVVHGDADIEVDEFWAELDPDGTKAEIVDESYGPPPIERDGFEMVAHGFGVVDRRERLSGRFNV
ncbi:class I SAM-dependent methyltransferase [Natrinema sp. CGMCC1.2065]|uniref:class I SAM-dependent methyltransferase n=1 Tax=Natrinema sp. CGMCC1.2065 TaxID=3445767 RepID=UPI003F49FD7E